MTESIERSRVGVVAIGRNEGERLRRCIESLLPQADVLVYVDSGSTDGSAEFAREKGVEVVDLDMSIPFTAARARNEGVDRLRAVAPDIEFVHFFDGDCEVCDGWIATALDAMLEDERNAVVWGLRSELHPDATIYNKVTDLEWHWSYPYGEVTMCGGDALMRLSAFEDVGRFNPGLIAGEEPELCFRYREKGWRIFRVRGDMTKHDAAITKFSQYWKRAVRAGHAYAQGAHLHGDSPERYCVRDCRRMWFWGLGVPVAAIGAAYWTYGLSLLLFGGYPVLTYRIWRYLRGLGAPSGDALLYAVHCVIVKFPGVLGQMKFHWNRLTRRQSVLIEYK